MKTTVCFLYYIVTAIIVNYKGVNGIGKIEDLLCNDLEAGSKIPHPEYCNVYLICANSTAKQMFCESKAYFDPDKEICDENYRICPSGNILADSGPLKPSLIKELGTTEPTSSSETTLKPTTLIQCPPADSEKITFISHEQSCSMYYLCYHGKPIPFQCTTGLHWSFKLKRCAPAEIAGCMAKEAVLYPGCPATGNYFMPHPDLCQYFLFCQNGIQSKQQCQPFYHWDVNERRCKLRTLATCFRDVKQATFLNVTQIKRYLFI